MFLDAVASLVLAPYLTPQNSNLQEIGKYVRFPFHLCKNTLEDSQEV